MTRTGFYLDQVTHPIFYLDQETWTIFHLDQETWTENEKFVGYERHCDDSLYWSFWNRRQ